MQSSQFKIIKVKPLKDSDKDFETIEKKLRELWKRELYLPIIKEFGAKSNALHNSRDDLLNAIKYGRIQFYRGTFSGRFNANISKELKALGASWERKTGTWKLSQSSLPLEVRNAISSSESHFQTKIESIDRRLAQIVPEEIADHLKFEKHFDSILWKVDKEFHQNLKHLTIAPQLTKSQRIRIATEWQNNMKLQVTGWTQKEIVKLRKDIRESVYAGNRHEAAIKIIRASHDVSINKAKFLARQETRLLLTKFKQTRYEAAGVHEYEWGISNHPIQPLGAPYVRGEVRHDHGVLNGKIFRWDNPPVTDHKTGRRNNPGQDYNCRCFATPIVRVIKRGNET